MTHADDMLTAAAQHSEDLAAPGLSPRPRRKVAVLACMDTRIDLFPLLGIERGDAHIVRNAGGLVTDDALRSLSVSQRLLGASDDDFARALAADGARPTWSLGAFDDVESALRAGLEKLRSAPELRVH